MPTWNASVGDLQVGLELGVAAGRLLEERVGNSQRAASSPGAARRHDVRDVRVASDESEVRLDAASDPHASVASRAYHDDRPVCALGVECFRQAVVSRRCTTVHNEVAKTTAVS